MVIGLAGLLLVAGAIASLIVVEAMNTEAVGRVTLERSQYMALWARYIENVSGTSNDSKTLQSELQKARTPDVRSIALVDESMTVLAGQSSSPRIRDALVLDAFSQSRTNRLTTRPNGQRLQRFAQRLRQRRSRRRTCEFQSWRIGAS